MSGYEKEIPKGAREEILTKEIQLWKNTAYLCSVRARVGKSADNQPYMEQALTDGVRAERMVDALETELKKIKEEKE